MLHMKTFETVPKNDAVTPSIEMLMLQNLLPLNVLMNFGI